MCKDLNPDFFQELYINVMWLDTVRPFNSKIIIDKCKYCQNDYRLSSLIYSTPLPDLAEDKVQIASSPISLRLLLAVGALGI